MCTSYLLMSPPPPPPSEGKNRRRDQDKERNTYLKTLWSSWYVVWQHLNGKVRKSRNIRFILDGVKVVDHEDWERFVDDGVGGSNRIAFVKEFQRKFDIFFSLWNAKHASEGLYLHILRAHAAEQMLKYGLLVPYQIQGLEHCNSKRKGYLRNSSKKRSVCVGKEMPKRKRHALTGKVGGRLSQTMLTVATNSYLEDSEARSDAWVETDKACVRARSRQRFKQESTVDIKFKTEI
jgi:hypothetical protein